MAFVRPFLLPLTVISLVIGVADWFVLERLPGAPDPRWLFGSLLFLYTITASVHALLLKAGKKRPQKFVTNFMATVTLKLFLSVIFLVAMALLNREAAASLLVHYLVIYLGFLVLEVIIILKALKTA